MVTTAAFGRKLTSRHSVHILGVATRDSRVMTQINMLVTTKFALICRELHLAWRSSASAQIEGVDAFQAGHNEFHFDLIELIPIFLLMCTPV